MGEWEKMSLADLGAEEVGAFSTGPFGSAVSAKHWRSTGTPMLRGSNLSEDVGTRLDDREVVYVSDELAAKFDRCLVGPGDLIFTCWGTVGQVGFVDRRSRFDSYVISNKQMKMTPNRDKVDPLFMYYLLAQPKMVDHVRGLAIGSSVPGFNLGQLKTLQVLLPSRSTQRAIAEVLGALDDKIAANDRVITLTDQLSANEVRAATAHGKRVRLGEIVKLHYGKALPASQRTPGNVLVFGSGGPTGTHNVPLVNDRGVVVGRKGTVGAVYWAPGAHFPIDTTYFVEPLEKLRPEVVYYLLKWLPLGDLNADSAVPGLNRSEAYEQILRIPEDKTHGRLASNLESRFDWSDSCRDESKKLAKTRDELLPLLMSGKIRVRDAEKVVSDVL